MNALGVVIAFDVGTTRLKWIVVEAAGGGVLWRGQEIIRAEQNGPASEQNPEKIWTLMDAVLDKAREYGPLERIALSAAMHSMMAVDRAGRPLTQSWTWMDKRAQEVAERVRESADGGALRRLTGVPVHSMSPLMKWLFVREKLPADARPVALKDYLVYRLTGTWQTDYSTASASGFLGLDGSWLQQAVDLAQVDVSTLPDLAPMTGRLKTRDRQSEVVIGGTDAATAHHHLQIPADGTLAVLAMGTSGAIRITSQHPAEDAALFCYTMGPGAGYLVGAAFSNVGNTIQWLADLFGLAVDAVMERGLEAIRSGRKLPGTLPYWQGERSPWWQETLAGTWSDMGPQTTQADLAGSTILAITASYWEGLRTLVGLGEPVQEIRAGSGLMANPAMGQWMADALNRDIVLYDQRDASLLGALDWALDHGPTPSGEVRRFSPQLNMEAHMAQEWARIESAVGGILAH